MGVKKTSSARCHYMSSKDRIVYYTDLLDKKKIRKNGAAHKRLLKLQQNQLDKFRKVISYNDRF
tara:strand:+ start:881 stop:1072 length:192 start_codon:yes stop_codon:yes gene_type:complete